MKTFVKAPKLILLAILLSLGVHHASAKLFDGAVDSANLGKGDWVYVLSYATNHLGGTVPSVTDIQSLMDYEASQGMQWIAVKASTGATNYPSDSNRQFNFQLVLAAHRAGLKIFGYNRSYGTDVQGEIDIAKWVFSQGADGLIMDAESEWESANLPNNTTAATNILAGIKNLFTNKFLAHSPFMYINYHSSFPYKQFGLYCDAVMPQDYWYSFAITPAQCIADMDTQWRNWQNGLTGGWTNAIKPIVPIGQADDSLITASAVTSFVNGLITDSNPATAGGYKGISWWRSDLHTSAQWGAISNGNIGGPFTANPPVPGTPTGLTATAASSTQINLSWTASANANNYIISRATTPGGPYVDLASTLETTYADTGLSQGITYYYVVFAANAGGESADSNEASATTSGAAYIIDNLAATVVGSWSTGTSAADKYATDYRYKSAGTGAAYVRFTPNLDTAGRYQVFEWHPAGSNRSSAAPVTIAYNGGSTVVSVNQKLNGGTWVSLGTFDFAAGTNGYAQISDNFPDTTQVVMADAIKFVYQAPPVPPAGVSANSGNGQVAISWSASIGATSYNVKRSEVNGGPYTTIANTAQTTYTDSTVVNGTVYYYVVTALNANGESANSGQVIGTPNCVFPATPTGLNAAAGNNQVALAWNAANEATSYNVKRSTTAGGPYTIVANPTANSYTDATAVNGTTYYYVVSAVNNCGETANSSEVSATPSCALAAVPTGVSASPGIGQVVISWSVASGATGYNVKRATVSGGPFSLVSSPTTTSYTDTDVVNETTYYYVVSAINPCGESADSTQVNATPSSTVAEIIIDNTNATVVGTWSTGTTATDKYGTNYRYKSPGTGSAYVQYTPNIVQAAGYTVYEWHPAGSNRTSAAPIVTTYDGGIATNYVNQQINGGTWVFVGNYKFAAGNSGYIRIQDNFSGTNVMADAIKLVYIPLPAAPGSLSATAAGASQIDLSWVNNATNAESVIVARGPAGGPYTNIATLASTATSYSDTGLLPGTTYHYIVKSKNATGVGSSQEASATTASATAVHVNSITMSWVASGNKYKARAVVNVRDANNLVVSGATVTGNFTGAIANSNLSAVSNTSGNATITSTSSVSRGTVTFTVTNITGSNMVYDSAANIVTSASITR